MLKFNIDLLILLRLSKCAPLKKKDAAPPDSDTLKLTI
ncbi:hypothetical protein D1AOALGA4SA_10814 [Olavius algarvensis Delta 1 endosymbiont]|nr:hypothetical protein D1AOALGA4SA_10814 [Olavius algarvensis Delta 1 endosymbiont]